MISQKYTLHLTSEEYSHIIHSLINLRNTLFAQGRTADAVDDLLEKLSRAKCKRLTI